MESVDCKNCSKCGETHSLSFFDNRGGGKLRNDCKNCVKKYSVTYRNLNKESITKKKSIYHKENPHIKRKSHLKKEFNITLQDYDNMLKSQNGLCKICGIDNVDNIQHKHLHIDHDHKTGKIRGLLCSKCNILLGACKDSLNILNKAIEYLQESKNENTI